MQQLGDPSVSPHVGKARDVECAFRGQALPQVTHCRRSIYGGMYQCVAEIALASGKPLEYSQSGFTADHERKKGE